ncbi:Acyl-CoA thioesterase [Saliniradius amylolyticus]|uniref:Acyl-CoA thioesterase 2 n=1 Tax=Saliniradius amylolyticus TaxID=2183582 RepID=A0A2S2E2K5_9ALTE|nr:acyl-CoA thioesterase II [Saliniradius amylolyticus]AWL11878.1 Acyl-CoA thioesterase [Saliniradius amylolyticus]
MNTHIKLTELLTLERLENQLFRGQSWDLGFKALFGGQVMAQALAAAQQTVEERRKAHSFHGYFLLPGDPNIPVVYDVENIRDGRSFATRRVKGIQHGRVIFYMTASFQIEEVGMTHQYPSMPDVPGPEELESDLRFYERYLEKLPKHMVEKLNFHKPIDMRSVQAINPLEPSVHEPVRQVWMKASDLGSELNMHQCALAYASDYYFLITAVQPHGISTLNRNLRMATIDHAMWFHRPFSFGDEWLLYCMESPTAGGARGLARGQIFNQQGELVASTMQEGLVRQIGENS